VGHVAPGRHLAENVYIQNEFLYIANCVFNLNFLAVAVSDITGGSQIYIKRPCAPRTPPSGKILTCTQVLAYTYITVKFQHRSSINVRLMESSLYNRFCIEWSPKMGYWGIWTPKHDLSSMIPQKGTSGRETTRFEP